MQTASSSVAPSNGVGGDHDLLRRRGTLRACCGAHVLHDGLVDMLYAVLPVLAQSLGLSYAQVGMIRAANKAATASLQIPAGLLAERFGSLPLLVIGTVIAGLAFVGLSAAESFFAILVGFFVAGCGGAVQHPLSSTLITGAFVGQGRRTALGIYNTFGDIGKFAFMGITILALGAGLSWQVPVFAFGLAAIGTAIAVWFALAGFEMKADANPDAVASDAAPAVKGWGVKSRAGVTALSLIASIDSASRIAFLTFVAFLMIEKGVATHWSALAVLITLFGGMCGKYACGLLAERVGIVKTIAITELWTGLGIFAVIFLPSYVAFAVLPILGVALNGTSSVIYGTVGELIDDQRHARAYGLIYTLGSVCGIVSPLVFGAIADQFGVSVSMILIGVGVCATLPLLPMLSRALRALPSGTSTH
ncbi:MAG: FSR family fosmidomycin resistance protein-like MFS transporter [Gammaproteobacteria bacterium]|jgi:FSR family fosmidomycin resistance protein-like MFS transporter